MPAKIVVPSNLDTKLYNTLRNIVRALEENTGTAIPLLKTLAEVRNIPDETSAYLFQEGTLFRYTKVGGKLFKEPVAIEEIEEIAEEAAEELDDTIIVTGPGITYSSVNRVTTTIKEYTVGSRIPTSFSVKWYATKSDYIADIEQDAMAAPINVSFDPPTPAQTRGQHQVVITYTPRSQASRINPAVMFFEVN